MVAILMVVAGTMASSFIRSSQRAYDMFRGTQAYYASRAAIEDAFKEAHDNGIGYEITSEDYYPVGRHAIEWDTTDDGVEDTFGDWEIWSRAKPADWQGDGSTDCQEFNGGIGTCYVIPIPGTGDAGDSCDFTNPEEDDQLWDTDEDDACNWNKIAYGDTVNIPLFTSDDASPFTGTEEFILRMRTPNGEILDTTSIETIATWEFNGDCGGSSCYLRPNFDSLKNYIYPSNINYISDYVVIKASDFFGATYIAKGLPYNSKTEESIQEFLKDASSSYFKLAVIGNLVDNADGITPIPYLEYQIIVDDEIISDDKVVYTAVGSSEGRLGTYTRNIQATQGLESASIVNFALQN